MHSKSGTVLVTGGAGYIGSHTVLALKEAGYSIIVIDNLSTGRQELVPDDVPLEVGEISDQQFVSRTIQKYKCKGVLHFAGSIIVSESVRYPLRYYENNSVVSRKLIECCLNEGVNNFVFSSTAAVYGNPTELPLTEDAKLVPINPYGSSKLITEWMLRDVSAVTDLRYAALRYFNVAGADLNGRSGEVAPAPSHLIHIASELVSGKRSEMSIFGDDYETPDGTCIRDYIHVSDLATAHVLAYEYLHGYRKNLIMNCGYGHGFSVKEVLEVVKEFADRPLDIKTAGRRDGDPAILVSNSQKTQDILGWVPQYDDLRVIVKSALDWEKIWGKRNSSCH